MSRMSCLAVALLALFGTSVASAADRAMTAAELKALFAVVKVFKLGGPSSGYYGALVLRGATAGTGNGVVYQGATTTLFKGTWRLDGNRFCRKWDKVGGGAEVCETFRYVTDTSVRVFVGAAFQGVNSW